PAHARFDVRPLRVYERGAACTCLNRALQNGAGIDEEADIEHRREEDQEHRSAEGKFHHRHARLVGNETAELPARQRKRVNHSTSLRSATSLAIRRKASLS